MKILRYSGIVALVLLAIFLVLGLTVPVFEYTTNETMNATQQRCLDVLQDSSQMRSWVPGFESMTLKSGEHNRPGAVYELIVKQDEVYVMKETIRDIHEPETISFFLDNDVMGLEYEFILRNTGDHTTLSGHYKVAGNNIAWRSLLFLSKSYLQKASQEQLDLLKKVVEQPH